MSKDIEDELSWHGKPIPKDRVDELLKDLEAKIQVPNKTLCPDLPIEDAAPVDYRPILLSSPPAYNKGDKVHFENMLMIHMKFSTVIWCTCAHARDWGFIDVFLRVLCLSSRWQPGERMAWPWLNWASQAREWWPSMETQRTPLSRRLSRNPSPIVTSSASSLNRTWCVGFLSSEAVLDAAAAA